MTTYQEYCKYSKVSTTNFMCAYFEVSKLNKTKKRILYCNSMTPITLTKTALGGTEKGNNRQLHHRALTLCCHPYSAVLIPFTHKPNASKIK